jgi:hypothetical protein
MSKAEKFISDCTRNCSNYTGVINKKTCEGYYVPWLTPDQARKAVETARVEIYKWLENNLALYDACTCFVEKCRLLKDLKKAMKDGSKG